MNSKSKWIAGAGVLVLLLIGAVLAYNRLADKVEVDPLRPSVSQTESGESRPQTLQAPDFQVQDTAGNTVSFRDFVGDKPIVINFWSSGCSPCRSEMPDFEKVYREMGDQVQFMMVDAIGVFGETVSSGKAFVEEQGYTFPVFFDTAQNAIGVYGIQAFPTTLFIDREGNIVTAAQSMLSEEILRKGIGMILPEEE